MSGREDASARRTRRSGRADPLSHRPSREASQPAASRSGGGAREPSRFAAFAQGLDGASAVDRHEATASPGTSWPRTGRSAEITTADDPIAARRLVVGAEEDRAAVRRDLDGAPRDPVGQRLAADAVRQGPSRSRRTPTRIADAADLPGPSTSASRPGAGPADPQDRGRDLAGPEAVGRVRIRPARARRRVARPVRRQAAGSRRRPGGPARRARRTRRQGRSSASRARSGRRSRRRRRGTPGARRQRAAVVARELDRLARPRADGSARAPAAGRRGSGRRGPRRRGRSARRRAPSSVGPTSVSSSAAASGSLPARRLATAWLHGSAGPETGTPRWVQSGRPASWTVVRSPPSTTSRIIAPARTGRARRARAAPAARAPGRRGRASVRPIRFQPPGIGERVDAAVLAGDRDAARRDPLPRGWRDEASPGSAGSPPRYAKPGANPRNRTRVGRAAAWSSTTSAGRRPWSLGDGVEVRAVGAAVADRDLDRRRGPASVGVARRIGRSRPARTTPDDGRSTSCGPIASGSNGTSTVAWAGTGRPTPGSPARAVSIARADLACPARQGRIRPVAERHEQRRVAERLDTRRRRGPLPQSRSAATADPGLARAPRGPPRAVSTASGLSPWMQIVSARTADGANRPSP